MDTIDDLDKIELLALLHNTNDSNCTSVYPTPITQGCREETDLSDADLSEDAEKFNPDATLMDFFAESGVTTVDVRHCKDSGLFNCNNIDRDRRQTATQQVADGGDTPAGPSCGDHTNRSTHDGRPHSPVGDDTAQEPSRTTEQLGHQLSTIDSSAIGPPDQEPSRTTEQLGHQLSTIDSSAIGPPDQEPSRTTEQLGHQLSTIDSSAIEPPDGVLYPSKYTSDEPEVLRVPNHPESRFLSKLRKWRSSGVTYSDLDNERYGITRSPYCEMTLMTPFKIHNRNTKRYDTSVMRREIPDTPQTDPTVGLERVTCEHGCDAHAPHSTGVCRTAVEGVDSNYMMGICASTRLKRKFTLPADFTYTPSDIPYVTVNCKTGDRVYYAVDLSKPPERGFRYVSLHVEEFPIGKRMDNILVLRSTDALYLGHVLTVQDVAGLLVHRIFSEDVQLLEFLLDMHTRLQIHPFVSRTFALHLMQLPFTDTGVTAVFVGEHVGEWNLGSPDGLANMTDSQKCTLAYHVYICLIKTQILTMRILGFPLLRLHPARIWRDGARFKVDFLACLLDHITSKLNSQGNKSRIEVFDRPITPVWGGVRAITDTLRTLGLDPFVPAWEPQRHYCKDCKCELPDGNIEVFYSMYEQLTQQDVQEVDMLSLLGEGETYRPFTVPTATCYSAPFAPFHVQIHNQFIKWNKVIIVEPVQNAEYLPLPMFTPRDPSTTNPQEHSSSAEARTAAREPKDTAPALRILPVPGPSKRKPPRRPSSKQTPAVSQARASHRIEEMVSIPHTPPSPETQERSSPAPFADSLDINFEYNMNTCNSVYYEG